MTRIRFLMEASEATKGDQKAHGAGRLVLRNTLYLGIAEVLSMPISVLLNAMIGRYLGPEDLGHMYLATTIAGLSFLLVSWGHQGSLPAAVTLDRASAGALLGSSIAWRALASVVAYVVVALGCQALGFTGRQQWAIGLVFLAFFFATILSACQETIRGFERTDIAAYSRVGSQLVSMMLVVSVLLLGGRMRLTLLAQALAILVVLLPVLRTLKPVGIGKVVWHRASLKLLMAKGTPFVFFALAIVLQPNVDAFYLAKLSPTEVVGWYAVSQKLIGFLLVPATALVGALYPTLCRLHVSDLEGFRRTARDSVATVSLLVVPVSLGCALYADIGVSIFGRDAFRPAEDTLRISSIYLFLVYFSMPIGTAIIAAGKQKAWTKIQLLCVLNSALLDPFLVRYFQHRNGNGGLGVSVASAISESLMVMAGVALMPRGIFDRALLKTLALTVASGGAMAGTAFALRALPSLVAAPIALLAYGFALRASGAVNKEQMAALSGFVRRKLSRGKVAAD